MILRKPILAAAALLAALLIAFLASRPPAPALADAPLTVFSAARAMIDVREISRAPRPTGSAENARVRSYLAERMRQLGMSVEQQAGPLPAEGAERLAKWGAAGMGAAQVVNLVGTLRGRDPSKPALLLMAHHDSVWASPGAADDAAGVAAALEVARAVRTRGMAERDLVLLFTDAEELGLDGAEQFFGTSPLARRIGAVINMEARGGGGRTAMFETGRANGRWIDLYANSVARPSSNSLAVLIYELMPNNTDFTIPKRLGLPGFNFAFIGRAELYHSPMSTPDAMDAGSLQDMGAQVLGVAAPLVFAPELPGSGENAVFGDVLGLLVIAYAPAWGWALLALIGGLFGFAFLRLRKLGAVTAKEIGSGTVVALALGGHAMLLLAVVNRISGSAGGPNYYDRLAALLRLEVQAFLVCLAVFLLACIARRPSARMIAAAPALGLALAGIVLGGWSILVVALGIGSAVAAMLFPTRGASAWGGWIGSASVVLVIGIAAQIAAPTATPLLHWPLVIAAAAAAFAAWLDPELKRPAVLIVVALASAVGAAQLLSLAHFTFLGVGAGMPEVMAIYALLVVLLLWPLFLGAGRSRSLAPAAAIMLVLSVGTALSVRLDPIARTVPPYSLTK